MKTKSLLGVLLGLAIISSGFYYIANEFISADKTTLSLLSPTSYYKPGDVFNVQVLLTTKEDVAGVDAFINYDPEFLEVVEVPVGDSVFDDYPGSIIRRGFVYKNGEIVVNFVAFSAGIKGGGMPFSGLGTVGAVSFKALKEGTTTLTIIHTPGDSRDSNVASASTTQDILEGVKGLDLTISSTTPKGK